MADRYWVGGTANWDGTAGTKWAATSGGPGGETVPTSADDVYFDANSGANTITVPSGTTVNCKSLICTGFTGTFTVAGSGENSGAVLAVHGSFTLVASMTINMNGFLRFAATTTGHTITSAGKTLGADSNFPNRTTFGVNSGGTAQAGGGWTLQDALVCVTGSNNFGGLGAPALQLLGGTLNTNGYSVTVRGFRSCFQMTGSTTKQLDMGSSTFYLQTTFPNSSGFWYSDATGTTLNAGTSNVIISKIGFGSSPNNNSIRTDGLSLYDLTIEDGCSLGIVASLTLLNQLKTLNTSGSSKANLVGQGGRTGKLTVGSASSINHIFIENIFCYGAAVTGTFLSDGGGNQGITFDPPKNCYRINSGTTWSGSTSWSDTSGGPANADYVPLIQDIAIFDNNSAADTNILGQRLCTIDSTSRTVLWIRFGAVGDAFFYGDFKEGSQGTLWGNETGCYFVGYRNTVIFKASGQASTKVTVIAKQPGASVEITSGGLSCSGPRDLYVSSGKFITNGYTVSCGSFIATDNVIPKEINFGSSTVNISYQGGFTLNNNRSLTFNAGTSTINLNLSINNTVSLTLNGLSVYDVVVQGGSVFNLGTGTVRNLTVNGGGRTTNVSGNVTITGTLTLNGTSATNRAVFTSNSTGTTRTLSVATFAGGCADVDFRDIAVTGAAAPISGTRFGDLQGNSGITFTSKTVYWNLAGTQNWNATAWASTSGGSPDANNFPLPQDTAVFDNAGSAGTVTINGAFNIGTVNMSARTSAMTLTTSTNAPVVYGNWLFGTGVTSSSTTGTITFAGRGTSTITSNGITFGCPINVNSGVSTGTVQLADALSLDAARTLTLTIGTFDAVTYNVTTGLFASSNSNVRTLKMGSGLWTLSGTGTVWNIATSTNLSLQQGTANILVSDTSTTSRTFNGGDQSYNKLTIGGATGTSTFIIGNNNQFTEIASTKTVAHTIDLNTSTQTFGKWSVTGTSGNVVTITGTGTGHILAGPATSGIDYLAMGSIGFAATSPGEFYAGANSTGTAGAPVFRTAPPAARTLYWVGGTGNWNDTARWSLSSGGAGGAALPTSLDDVVFDSASNATGYTVSINLITGGNRIKSWTASGPATGTVTFSSSGFGGSSVPLSIHDNVSFAATNVASTTFYATLIFSGNQTGRTITTNGVNFNATIIVNGVGCEWSLGSALSSTSAGGGTPGSCNVINGTLDFNTYNFTSTGLFSQNNNKRTLDFGSGTITTNFLAGITAIGFSGQNFTFVRGTSTYNTPILAGALLSHFYNLTLTDGILAGVRPAINSDIICENNFTCTGTSITARVFLISDTIGVTRTITCASATINNTDIRDITIAGAAAPVSPTGAADAGGNSGITFPAPKTVYRVGTNTTWLGSSSWALTSGGTGSNNNVPLYQDTAIIDESTALTGTLTITGGISALDCSTRTTGITLNFSDSTWYGSLTIGSGVTVSGTSTQTFSSRSRTMTLTSAGKTITFPITVDALGGTFQLGDALNSNSSITLTRGTFNANNNNVTATTFASSNSNVRTITMGSGLWTFSGTGNLWNLGTITNLTFNANTANIVLSNTSTTARTFTGGGFVYNNLTIGGATGTSTTTITGNNVFNTLASTKTVAHTIALGGTLQIVDNWTISGSSGNLVTLTGSPAYLLYDGTSEVSGIDYLNINNIIAAPVFPVSNIWYAGVNSIPTSALGWGLEASPAPPPVVSGGNMFLLFM